LWELEIIAKSLTFTSLGLLVGIILVVFRIFLECGALLRVFERALKGIGRGRFELIGVWVS